MLHFVPQWVRRLGRETSTRQAGLSLGPFLTSLSLRTNPARTVSPAVPDADTQGDVRLAVGGWRSAVGHTSM